MAAVWIRLRAELRSRWRAWLTLAVLAGLAGGLVIATAAGARRTDSAVARYQAEVEPADVWVGRGELWALDIDFSRVERLPQVAQATRSFDLAFWGRTEAGRPVTVHEVELNVAVDGRDGAKKRPKLLAGRAPDPAVAEEIYVGSRAAEHYDLGVGSTLRMRFATRREVARIADTGEHNPKADPETAGTGPLLTLRVVGIRADITSEDATRWISMSPGFYDTYGRRLGAWIELTGIWLKRGEADLAAFRAGVERIANGKTIGFFEDRDWVSKLQSSIHLQAQALWVVAALAGIVSLLLVGQALVRQVALESTEYPLLRSLGMTRAQLFSLGMLRVAPVSVTAAALAAGVAVAFSPLTPIGVARTAEPDPGLALDPQVVGMGGAATGAVLLLASLVPVWRASQAPSEDRRAPFSAAVNLAARAGLPPSAVSGVRLALEPGRGRTAVPVRSTLLSAVVAVAAAATALTITASADHLLGTPRLYGQNWDVVLGAGTEPRYPERFVAGLRADPSIGELAVGTVEEARVGGRPTGVLATEQIRGSLSPTVLEGRAPSAASEILLGAKTARALDAEIGDEVEARIGDRAFALRVVGRGVLPDFGVAGAATMALGEGAAMTFKAVRRLNPSAAQNVVLIGLAPGADRQAILARLERDASATVPRRPAEVGNWGRVSGFPYLFAALIAAAAAALLAHALVTSIRRRRRDLAILKTLGFERHDLQATVAWQATTIAAMGLLVGLPLGVGIGRFAWNLFATELGVVPEPVAPVLSAFFVIPATLLLANLVALLPGRIAAGTRPAVVLRAE